MIPPLRSRRVEMNETVGRCRERKGRKGERKVDPPRWQPVQRVFGRLALTVGPRIHLRRYPRTVPSHTRSHSNQLRALPDALPNPSSRTGRPQLAATTSLKRDLWGDTGTGRGGEKGWRWKKAEVEKGWWKEPCSLVRSLRCTPLPVVPRAARSGEWREIRRCLAN